MTARWRFLAASAALFALQSLAVAGLSAVEPDQTVPTVDPTAAPPDKTIVVQGDKNKVQKKYCHSEIPTGSITAKRICRTQAELDADAERAQLTLDQMRTYQMRADVTRKASERQ